MTLFELLAVACALLCGAGVASYASSVGGFWLGFLGFLVGTGAFILLAEGSARLSCFIHRRRKRRKKMPCGICNETEYDCVGGDADHDPIAECRCGIRFVLKKGKWMKL